LQLIYTFCPSPTLLGETDMGSNNIFIGVSTTERRLRCTSGECIPDQCFHFEVSFCILHETWSSRDRVGGLSQSPGFFLRLGRDTVAFNPASRRTGKRSNWSFDSKLQLLGSLGYLFRREKQNIA
jgi:hypothetical protein